MRYVKLIASLITGLLLLGGNPAFSEGRVPTPTLDYSAVKADKCVEPTEIMRRDHMEFILHQRDETVHRGIRTSKHSFRECINCHVVTDGSGQAVDHKNKVHFCVSCHEYAAVQIDCFDCHASKPEKEAALRSEVERVVDGMTTAPAEN